MDLEFPIYYDALSPFPEHLPEGPQRKAQHTPPTDEPIKRLADEPEEYRVTK